MTALCLKLLGSVICLFFSPTINLLVVGASFPRCSFLSSHCLRVFIFFFLIQVHFYPPSHWLKCLVYLQAEIRYCDPDIWITDASLSWAGGLFLPSLFGLFWVFYLGLLSCWNPTCRTLPSSFLNIPFVMPMCADTAVHGAQRQRLALVVCVTMHCSKPLARSPGEESLPEFSSCPLPSTHPRPQDTTESLEFIQVELHRHALLCLVSFAQHNVLKTHTFYLFLLQSNILWYGYITFIFYCFLII